MCQISENSQKALTEWAKLQKKLAPLLARVKKYEDAAKVIEDQVKAELESFSAGSVETDHVTVTFSTRTGAVDWKKFVKDQGISKDLMDSFRKKSVKAFSFNLTPPEENEVEPTTPPAATPPEENDTRDVDVLDPDQQEPQHPVIPAEPSDSSDSDTAAPIPPEDSDQSDSDDADPQKSLVW